MKKIIALVLITASLLFSFTSCHQHTWVEATCSMVKYCSDCYMSDGEELPCDYYYGKCRMCGEISAETRTEIEDTVKSLYVIYWVLNCNEYVELTRSEDMIIESMNLEINENKAAVSGTIRALAKNEKYYVDNFDAHLICNDSIDWVNDADYKATFNTQPIECYSFSDEKVVYKFTENPTYTYNTYSGQARSTMSFTDSTCTVKIYNYYGGLDSSSTFNYVIYHGIAWDIVLLDGAQNDIELVKMDNGLIWDEMVFLLD